MKTLIFGGSSGMGKAVALKVAEDNSDVLICSRNEEKLKKAENEIYSLTKNKINYIQLDLSDLNNLEYKLEKIMMDFGIPSRILINGGGPVFGAFEDISLDAWDLYINQVIKSNVIILKKLLPQMNNNGSIVFILSDVVRNAGPGKILPCSLRMALIGIIKCLAFEYAEKNIRINAVSPGPVETERAVSLLNKSAENNNISFNEMKNEFTKDLPMKRMGRPEEIAELVNFLFSDKSTYITGANIICDGGLTVMPV